MKAPRRASPLRAWRGKAAAWAPVIGLVLCVLAAVVCVAWLGVALHDNRTIARLASGHDIDVGANASPAVTFARAKFFMDREDFEQSQPLVERVAHAGQKDMTTHVLYDAGNTRLHHAIRLIEDNKFDAAAADVILARDFYTRALRIDPEFWDAKYNLDIAMRLVRDLPDVDIPGQDLKQPTSKLWTDLPGLPKGGP
jgi:mxaK protein